MVNKILLSIFLLTSLAFGANSYEFIVDSPTMVEVYWNIFNAMSAMFKSPQYLEILKLVFLVGGVFVFIIGVLKTYQGGAGTAPLGDFVKYLIVGMALLMMLFSHPSNLIIKTNKLPSLCETTADLTRKNYLKGMISFGGSASTKGAFESSGTVVGNIPMVLAWTFSFVNEIGRETTKLATSAFSDETKMIVFNDNSDYASYLSTISSLLSLKMPTLVSDMIAKDNTPMSLLTALDALQRDCVLIPASKSENAAVASGAFSTTGDLYRTMVDLFENNTVSIYRNPTEKAPISTLPAFTYDDNLAPKNVLVTVHGETMRCGYLWNKIKPGIAALMNSDVIECAAGLDQKLNGSTISLLTGKSGLTSASSGPQIVSMARTIGIHAALMNHFIESKNKVAPGEFSYAAGKSIAEFTTSSLGTGYYMAKMLPKIQMGMRAVLYAFFPFVFIVVLLPGGFKNLVSYLQTLIWIELWMPTAAILNMFMALQSQESMRVLYDIKGLNMSNSLQIFSDATQMASVAGYLYASVPALTWLILKGSGQMLGNITGAVAARMANNLDSRVINQDMQDLSKVEEYNNMRKNMGQELVSLAEMDANTARMRGMSEAGEFAARSEQIDNLSKSEYGKSLDGILSGVGKYNLYNDEKYGKSAREFAKNEAMMKFVGEMAEKGALGFVNKDGSINIDQIEKFNRIGGIKKLIELSAEGNLQAQNAISKLIQASSNQKFKEVGDRLGIPKMQEAVLDAMAASGIPEISKRAQKIKDDYANHKITREEMVAQSAEISAPIGAYARIYGGGASDWQDKTLVGFGILDTLKGILDASNYNLKNVAEHRFKNMNAGLFEDGRLINAGIVRESFTNTDSTNNNKFIKQAAMREIGKHIDLTLSDKSKELEKLNNVENKSAQDIKKIKLLNREINALKQDKEDLAGNDMGKAGNVASKYAMKEEVFQNIIKDKGANQSIDQIRDLNTKTKVEQTKSIAGYLSYDSIEKTFGTDRALAMYEAVNNMSTLSASAQYEVYESLAKYSSQRDLSKEDIVKKVSSEIKGKFGVDILNSLKNALLSPIKGR